MTPKMLAAIGQPPLPLRHILEGFLSTSATPAPGWGVSGFSKDRAVYFDRRIVPLGQDQAEFASAIKKAEASTAPVIFAYAPGEGDRGSEIGNVQPFHYRDWIFVHRGDLSNSITLVLDDAKPQGVSDSERLMLWMLPRVISSLNPTEELIEVLRESREKISCHVLSFLISDGKTLWAYQETRTPAKLSDAKLYAAQVGSTKLFSADPISAITHKWEPIKERTLLVCSSEKTPPQSISVD